MEGTSKEKRKKGVGEHRSKLNETGGKLEYATGNRLKPTIGTPQRGNAEAKTATKEGFRVFRR